MSQPHSILSHLPFNPNPFSRNSNINNGNSNQLLFNSSHFPQPHGAAYHQMPYMLTGYMPPHPLSYLHSIQPQVPSSSYFIQQQINENKNFGATKKRRTEIEGTSDASLFNCNMSHVGDVVDTDTHRNLFQSSIAASIQQQSDSCSFMNNETMAKQNMESTKLDEVNGNNRYQQLMLRHYTPPNIIPLPTSASVITVDDFHKMLELNQHSRYTTTKTFLHAPENVKQSNKEVYNDIQLRSETKLHPSAELKRSGLKSACTTCTKRKIKCMKNQDSLICDFCSERGLECTFLKHRKRGRPRIHYLILDTLKEELEQEKLLRLASKKREEIRRLETESLQSDE